MKAITALVIVALLGVSAYNMRQIQVLQAEVADMRSQMAQQKKSNDLLAEAMQSVQQARDAMGRVDTAKASGALQRAGSALGDAAKLAGEKAGPAIRWLEGQVKGLSDQVRAQQGATK
ncbi:MAG: hypothetical protein FJX72_15990 [Armatimonadetes bacterium]|nr:hypothetical protein [Armatimonadota bacterium]